MILLTITLPQNDKEFINLRVRTKRFALLNACNQRRNGHIKRLLPTNRFNQAI